MSVTKLCVKRLPKNTKPAKKPYAVIEADLPCAIPLYPQRRVAMVVGRHEYKPQHYEASVLSDPKSTWADPPTPDLAEYHNRITYTCDGKPTPLRDSTLWFDVS